MQSPAQFVDPPTELPQGIQIPTVFGYPNNIREVLEAPSPTPEFKHWPKIPRLSKEACFITEKIDGTNGIIHISDNGDIRAGSRNRWLTPQSDNYGFCRWVYDNASELRKLGPGYHYGEWWGLGIQRGYGLNEKRFSLFVGRKDGMPPCVGNVPFIYSGPFSPDKVAQIIDMLCSSGSLAVPGFMKPEGIVVYLKEAAKRYKVLCENDNLHKSQCDIKETNHE